MYGKAFLLLSILFSAGLGFALLVEGFELFQLFRALGEGLGALEEHGVAEGEDSTFLLASPIPAIL